MGADQNLTLNPNSWAKVANMIYLDSPCGVGLSYSTNTNDYNTNDKITAKDSYNFLLNFFDLYPQFSHNDFYIAGESYAGIYVPTLAQQVMIGNQIPQNFINMKGILVGNGVTDQVFDGNAWIPFVYGHSFISDQLNEGIMRECGSNIWNATRIECQNYLNNASVDVQSLNIYNVYLDCYQGGAKPEPKLYDLMNRVTARARAAKSKTGKNTSKNVGGNVPCIDSQRAAAWINQDTVRTAFYAISVAQQEWMICSNQINYTSIYTTVIPIHQQLLANGYRILIYSGDADMCVPNTGSEAWTSSLNLPLLEEWRPWFVNNQVAGYVRSYEGLTYATIKGAGHMVPQYRPPQALYFFTQFLNNRPF